MANLSLNSTWTENVRIVCTDKSKIQIYLQTWTELWPLATIEKAKPQLLNFIIDGDWKFIGYQSAQGLGVAKLSPRSPG